MIFSTYIGGNNYDYGIGTAVDNAGNCYITGYTESGSFPTKNAFKGNFGGYTDIFVTKFNSFSSPSTIHSSNTIIGPPLFLNYTESNKQLFLFTSSFEVIITFIPLMVILPSLYLLFEFRSYKISRQSTDKQKSDGSFKQHLIYKYFTRFKRKKPSNSISDKTFELLEVIEKENIPDK